MAQAQRGALRQWRRVIAMTRRLDLVAFAALFIFGGFLAESAGQPPADNPIVTLPQAPVLAQPFGAVPAQTPRNDLNIGGNSQQIFAPLQTPAASTSPPEVQGTNGQFTIRATQSTLGEIIAAIAKTSRVDVVMAGEGSTKVSLNMYDRPLEDILTAVCLQTGHVWRRHQDVILVSPLATETPYQAQVQGRVIEAIQLDYVAAADVQTALQDLLSPVGKLHVMTSSKTDHLKSREVLIVEDLADNVARLIEFARTLDVPPRQVMIEAYVLQVDLEKNQRHGVNFEKIFSWNGTPLSVEMTGFANESASQAFMARLDASSLTGVLEFLKSQTDSRTLASPRLLVVNGQEKRLQVGQQLGYRTVTTTQSGLTQENVNFLDVGVVLSVTPRISGDQRILLNVNSKVSTGLVNPETGLPEESTSEVDTDVLLEDGYGIVIGGLIQEGDNDSSSGVIGLSDIPYLGGLFRRRQIEKERKEIIFVIVPRILPDPTYSPPGYDCLYERATTPLHPSTCLPSVQHTERGVISETIEVVPAPHASAEDFWSRPPSYFAVEMPPTDDANRQYHHQQLHQHHDHYRDMHTTPVTSPEAWAQGMSGQPHQAPVTDHFDVDPRNGYAVTHPAQVVSFQESDTEIAPAVPPALKHRKSRFLGISAPKLPKWLGGEGSTNSLR